MDIDKIPQNQLFLVIKDINATIFSDYVKVVSSINVTGKFDILPLHSNFISIIKDELSFIDKNDKKLELKLESGVIKVKSNVVHVFLGIDEME